MGLFDFFRKKELSDQEKLAFRVKKEAKSLVSFAKKAPFLDMKGLNYSPKSLHALDALLEECSDFADDMPRYKLSAIMREASSYILLVAHKQFGGRYGFDSKKNKPFLIVGEPDYSISLFPFEKVKMRIKNGREDNIPFFYQGFKEKIDTAKAGQNILYC